MKNKDRAFNLVFYIFAVFGMIFVVIGILMLISNIRFTKDAVEVNAVIAQIESYRDSDGDINHRVFVNYSYGGKTYEGIRLGEYDSNMYEGKEIKLLLNPVNPQKISTRFGMIFGSSMFIGMGAIFALVGIIPLIVMARKKVQKKKLLAQGSYIYATVEDIQLNTGYSVNGRHPYVIYCTYRDEYKDIIYRFKSDNIWTNPGHIIEPGSEIRVYVDGTDYSKYHVDAESILDKRIVDYT